MLSRAEAIAFRNQAFMLACHIGLRPAARAIGIKEDRIRQWAKRFNWQISTLRPSANCPRDSQLTSPTVTEPIKALAEIMSVDGDRTRLAMARTARRAFEHCDELTPDQLHDMARAIALEKHGRNASVAHSWNSNQVGVAVQVNVPLPGPEEREEMRSIDAKLDAIAAKLKS